MSVGLLALLDDVAALVKMSAASLDDVAGMAAKAGLKASGAVIDDAAVTPRYVSGLSPERELPIVAKIARGSIRNKLLYLLPAALLLSAFLPTAITPLLMIGGAYLCYEGAEKVVHSFTSHADAAAEGALDQASADPQGLEDARVAGAIKTDFILSAEIMTIALAAIPVDNLLTEAVVLALVAVGITAAVYGGVALIVKADDFGLRLARITSDSLWARLARNVGRALVKGMPAFMDGLSAVGTAAMIWVGGGIVVHGMHSFGLVQPGDAIVSLGTTMGALVAPISGAVAWVTEAAAYGVCGLLLGAALIPLTNYMISPIWKKTKALRSS